MMFLSNRWFSRSMLVFRGVRLVLSEHSLFCLKVEGHIPLHSLYHFKFRILPWFGSCRLLLAESDLKKSIEQSQGLFPVFGSSGISKTNVVKPLQILRVLLQFSQPKPKNTSFCCWKNYVKTVHEMCTRKTRSTWRFFVIIVTLFSNPPAANE